jgi:teichuronic acid biosynthesis glycosyltransferase TuaG
MYKNIESFKEKVSIVMPAYECEAYIGESIESVIGQTYKNIELIVVVDGGRDSTIDIVSRYCKMDSRIVLVKHKTNLGIAEARNSGIRIASGDFFGFCDSDDVWLPFKLEMQLELMVTNGVSISHSSALLINNLGDVVGYRKSPNKVDYTMMRSRNHIINSSALVKQSSFPNMYQSQMRHEDYDFWLRLFAQGAVSQSCDEPLLKYRVHGESITSNKLKSLLWMCLVQRKHGIEWSTIFLNALQNCFYRLVEYGQIWLRKFKKFK